MCKDNSKNDDKNENDNKMASKPSHTDDDCGVVIRAYLLVWCAAYSVPLFNAGFLGHGVGGLDERPLVEEDFLYLIPLACLLFFVVPSGDTVRSTWRNVLVVPLATVVHVVDLGIRWKRMPHVWDHEQWACQVELAFLLCYCLPHLCGMQAEQASSIFVTTFRLQFAMLYAAATFWKINPSFFNVETSCGSVLILELVGTHLPALSEPAVKLVAALAPPITLVTEAGLGLVMLLAVVRKSRFYRYASVVAASGFHVSIFLLPVNSAGAFTMDCMRHLLLFFEPDEFLALHGSPTMVGAYIVGTASLLRYRYYQLGVGLDFGFLGMCLLVCWYTHLTFAAGKTMTTAKTAEHQNKKQQQPRVLRLLSAWTLFVTFCYAFVGPILGVQHMGAPTMYSNLRYYFGGNHYWVPTSMLPDDILFGGSLVHVVASTHAPLNKRVAHIPSATVFPAVPMQYFETAISNTRDTYQLFPLCISNPHSFKVLKEDYEAANPQGSTSFASFLLPMSEVRKALAEFTPFDYSITFTDANPNGAITPDSHFVVLSADEGCMIVTQDGTPTKEICEQNSLARTLMAPSDPPVAPLLGSLWLAETAKALREKLLTPYPQLVGWDQEMCMS